MHAIHSLRRAYHTNSLPKPDFIHRMNEIHQHLFAYSELLQETNISSIHIHGGEVIAEFRDPSIKMTCPPGDQRIAPIEALNFGSFEPVEMSFVRRLLAHLGGASAKIFDIGANAGFYSLALSKYFPGLEGVAFEPVPLTYSYLRRNLNLNHITEIKALNLGLSDNAGELIFSVSPEHSGASFISVTSDGENQQAVACLVTTVDDFISNGGVVPTFIKCDVEGAELLVFKGARRLLGNDRPAIFTEMLRKWASRFGYHPNDLISYFSEFGYSCFVIRGNKLLPLESVNSETPDTNYIFLHKENHAAALLEFC
jgi:FkbM family methyltransferase